MFDSNKKILVTGGAGFIGSALIRALIKSEQCEVVNVDKLTYAGNLSSLGEAAKSTRYQFFKEDICDAKRMEEIFHETQPDYVMHLAAESHVDRSIDGPKAFIHTNVVGTTVLLEAFKHYWDEMRKANPKKAAELRFHHISTDEVFGDLAADAPAFDEDTPYAPSSPYAASKAASDHLVRAWHRTYHLPIIITNCSNNYGPYQFPEKLIPLVILNALDGKPIPVYGDGSQIRDWLYVEDHANALIEIVQKGLVGETYNIGGNAEKKNVEVVQIICDVLDKHVAQKPANLSSFRELVTFVKDRPGHDTRYAINSNKLKDSLGWVAQESFEKGIEKTIIWYLNNNDWWQPIRAKKYAGERLGR